MPIVSRRGLGYEQRCGISDFPGGKIPYTGHGVPVDRAESRFLLKMAADLGDMESQYMLAAL